MKPRLMVVGTASVLLLAGAAVAWEDLGPSCFTSCESGWVPEIVGCGFYTCCGAYDCNLHLVIYTCCNPLGSTPNCSINWSTNPPTPSCVSGD